MKLALLFSGHLRSFPITFDGFKNTILNHHEVDVFCSTWETYGWWTGNSEGANISDEKDSIDFANFQKLYNPIILDTQKYFGHYQDYFENRAKTFDDKHTDKRVRLVNPLSMYYKMQRVINIFEDFIKLTQKQYDVVIRTRPDLVLSDFTIEAISDIVVIDGSKGIEGRGLGDMMQMGTQENILKFNRLFDDYDEIMRCCALYDPHLYIEKYLSMKNIKYKAIQRFTLHNGKNGQWH